MDDTGILPNKMGWPRPSLPNVTRHSGWWPHTVTPSIDRTLHHFSTVTDLDLITEFDFLPNCAIKVSIEHMQRVRHANVNREHLTPPDTWSHWDLHETNLSWTCLVSGLLNFKDPSVLLFCFSSMKTNIFGWIQTMFLYFRLQTGHIMVWWCPSIRPSVRPSVRPPVTVFRTYLRQALTYWAEILHVTFFL